MKKTKVILLFIFIMLLCGCSVEYNIDITNDEITEDINVYVLKSKEDEMESLKYHLNNDIISFTSDGSDYYYSTEAIEDDNFSGINLNFSYADYYSYAVSSFFTGCFEKSNISSENNKLYIKASNYTCQGYNYIDVDNAVINLTTNYKVIEHNADVVNNSVYTWNISKNNKDIQLVLEEEETISKKPSTQDNEQTNKKDDKSQEIKDKNSWISTLMVILLLMGFVAALALIFLFKINKMQR